MRQGVILVAFSADLAADWLVEISALSSKQGRGAASSNRFGYGLTVAMKCKQLQAAVLNC